jgi:hypothetical protein
MSAWTPTQRAISTPYGRIFYGGPCKDDYANMVTYDQGGGRQVLTLQEPAMQAWFGAQVRYARRSGWSKARINRNWVTLGKWQYLEGRPILVLPGTNRSCATQTALYRSDSSRYARPEITGHTRGLAVDLDQRQPNLTVIRGVLALEGWKQVRPDDEPWHCSFFVSI